MANDQNVGGRDRLVRALLAAVSSVLALRWLKAGKRGRGLLASLGALVFGFNATTGYCPGNETLGVDTTADDTVETNLEFDSDDTEPEPATSEAATSESSTTTTDAYVTCAVCGEPIVAGQSRGPNEQGETVHDDCV